MTHIIDNITSEGLTSTLNYRGQITATPTSASTVTLSLASSVNQTFTGTTANQIINLGVATNYLNGHEWWIYNESNKFISVRNNSSTELLNLPPAHRVKIILKDNSTSAGIWIIGVLNYIGSGGMIVAMFADTASNINNKFLGTENIAASDTLPAVVPRTTLLNLVTYTCTTDVSSCTLEIRINATTGTPAASIAVTTTNKTFTGSMSIPAIAGDQLNVKVTNASNVSKPLVKIYCT